MYAPSSPPSLRSPAARSERVLDSIPRTSEVLFGLIMALTFSGTLSAATAEREDIRVSSASATSLRPLQSPGRISSVRQPYSSWVFLSTFPVVIPFVVFKDVHFALRASNAVAIVMMFVAGYWLAGTAATIRCVPAPASSCLGVVLVGIAIALGG
jgi:hypothetical protein